MRNSGAGRRVTIDCSFARSLAYGQRAVSNIMSGRTAGVIGKAFAEGGVTSAQEPEEARSIACR